MVQRLFFLKEIFFWQGPSTRVTLLVDDSSALWTLHWTHSFSLYWFLCQSLCSYVDWRDRNEKGVIVSKKKCFLHLKKSWFVVQRKTANYYICSYCQVWYEQPLGKIKIHEQSGGKNVNYHYRQQAGPTVTEKCPECESTLHVSVFSHLSLTNRICSWKMMLFLDT